MKWIFITSSRMHPSSNWYRVTKIKYNSKGTESKTIPFRHCFIHFEFCFFSPTTPQKHLISLFSDCLKRQKSSHHTHTHTQKKRLAMHAASQCGSGGKKSTISLCNFRGMLRTQHWERGGEKNKLRVSVYQLWSCIFFFASPTTAKPRMWWGSVSSDESNTFSAFPRGLDLIFLLLMCAFQGNVISFFFVISPEGRKKIRTSVCLRGMFRRG